MLNPRGERQKTRYHLPSFAFSAKCYNTPVSQSSPKTVALVGAGIGGLAAAIRLRVLGCDVTVYEKNARVGGRCNLLEDGGFRFDVGPSLLLMPDVFRELFAFAGDDLDARLRLVKMEPNYRVSFADGTHLDMSSDLARMVPQLEAIEPGVAAGYYAFLRDAGLKYRHGRFGFVEKNFIKATDFFTARNLSLLGTLGATKKLYAHVSKFFRDPRLRQVFSMQSMYLGISPFEAPAVYTLLSYTEIAEDGLWFTMGGTYALPRAMEALAQEKGVVIHTNAPVERIVVENGKATGVMVNGAFAPADIVLSNADLPYTYLDLLPPEARGPYTEKKLDSLAYTASAFMMYLGTDVRYDHLRHHNFFLGKNYKANFDAIFHSKTLPTDPSFYVNCPAHTDPTLAPPGGDNVFVLVPIPHLSSGVDWETEKERFTEKMYRLLEERAGMTDLGKHVVVEHIKTPFDWRDEFNLRHGAAFGLAHGMTQVGYFRPPNRCKNVPNLYFVGASTTPGTGLPLVTIGARLVSERIAAEQGIGTL